MNVRNDYDRTCFLIKKLSTANVIYYLRINGESIEVSESVFKVCRRSYDKIRKDKKRKVDRCILNYEDIDQSTFFLADKNSQTDILSKIYIKDIAEKIKKEISLLPERNKNIAICIFIEEYSDRETSRLLHIPQTTVTYRKNKIREKIKNKIIKFCSIED